MILVVEHGGDLLARIGVMRALYPDDDTVPTPRGKRVRKYRIVR